MINQALLAVAAFATVTVSGVAAQAMPDARLHICQDIQEIVAAHGAVNIRTGEFTFERVVTDMSQCSNAGDETTRPAYIQTSDGLCFAGYSCVQDNRGGNGG